MMMTGAKVSLKVATLAVGLLSSSWLLYSNHCVPPVQAASAARPGSLAAALGAPPLQVATSEGGIHQDAGQTPSLDWSAFLPAGEGQFQTSIYCSSCHTLQSIAQRRGDETDWTGIVRRMVSVHAAPIQADDAAVISKYLATQLGPAAPKLDLPIHINTAPKEVLNLMGKLSPADVQKIIDTREKQKITDFASLEALIGAKKVAKYKTVISYT
jgi:hypothetical protein